MATKSKKKLRPVVILDTHRGIYFGYLAKTLEGGNAVQLECARWCYYYPTVVGHEGPYGLGSYGPGEGAKIGPPVKMKVRDVSKVVDCTASAVERWENSSWER